MSCIEIKNRINASEVEGLTIDEVTTIGYGAMVQMKFSNGKFALLWGFNDYDAGDFYGDAFHNETEDFIEAGLFTQEEWDVYAQDRSDEQKKADKSEMYEEFLSLKARVDSGYFNDIIEELE